MNADDKSDYIGRLYANVPADLKELPVWLLWKSLPSKEPGKKPRKVPHYANGTVRGAGLALDCPEDRAQLVTMAAAIDAYRLAPYAGLGVALGAVPDTAKILCGIDLDNIAPDEPRVVEVVSAANSYTETSPSGTGLKIFGVGSLENLRADKYHLEIYGSARFFAVTGRALNGSALADLTEAAFAAKRLFLPPTETAAPSVQPAAGKFVDSGRHNYLVKIAARNRARGLEGDELLAVLRVHNAKHCAPPKPDAEVVEIAEWAAKQSASATDAPRIELHGPAEAIGSYEEWHGFPFEPPQIVANYMPEDAGGTVGPGGHGKTTLALYEAVLICLGRPLYGREIVRAGPTLIVTAEDLRPVVFSRLNEICRALRLSSEEIERVRLGIFVEDVTGSLARIAQANRYGIVQPGDLLPEIIDKYRDARLAVVVLDPTSLLGPGETFGNDGAAELLRISRYLSRELRAAVRLIHHVSQAVAREKIMDQYAARGGTAFVDNSRFQHQLIVLEDRRLSVPAWGVFRVPEVASDVDIAKGRVLAILVWKLSYSERDRVPIFLLRKGFEFTHMVPLGGDMTMAELDKQTTEDIETLRAFLCAKLERNIRLTVEECASSYLDELRMTRTRLRKAATEAKALGVVKDEPLPEGERKGQRTKYMLPASERAM